MGKCLAKASHSRQPSRDAAKPQAASEPDFLSIIPTEKNNFQPHADTSPSSVQKVPATFAIKGALPTKPLKASEDKPVSVVPSFDVLRLAEMGLSYVCRKGLKSEDFSQDDFCIIRDKGSLLVAVFDGHGPDGHKAAAAVRESLPKLLLAKTAHQGFGNCARTAFDESHQDLITNHKELSAELSGTTASLILLEGSTLHYASAGDSSIVLARRIFSKLHPEKLSVDHKPTIPQENQRIMASGGIVKKMTAESIHRIFEAGTSAPGLALSRAIGDVKAHRIGVVHEPDTGSVELNQDHEFVLVCSDGIWEFVSPEEAVEVIGEYPRKDGQDAVNALAGLAWSRWLQEESGTVDDLTCVLVPLPLTL